MTGGQKDHSVVSMVLTLSIATNIEKDKPIKSNDNRENGKLMMEEMHENEQYFFTPKFLKWFADTIDDFFHDKKVCCICCPSLGVELASRGVDVKILDIDERFEMLRKYTSF